MKQEIKIIELFSGIGGFSKGLEQAGFEIEKHYFSEIDKHAIANYKYNYPNAEYIGSVVDIRPRDFRDIDIITFGSPCQDFSLAGKRKGLEGERSSLIEYAIRAITDIRPSVFIWENVKGAFSSNSGADFWAILQAFANIGGYRLEWQLLNTKWFLPQNRERIYLIGHLANRSEPGVFPIGENDELCSKTYENCKKIQPNYRTALTLTAKGSINGNGDYIKVKSATSKGYEIASEGDSINLSNPNSETRRGRIGKVVAQTLDCSCNQAVISSFTRDKKGKVVNRNDRNICNTITSATGSGGSTDVFVNNIRRLTEIECERLQGFPQQKIFICLEKIKNHAQNAEVKFRKLQKFVLTVEKIDLNLNALFANQNLNIKQVQKNKLVRENVHINFGENVVEIHNQGKLIFSAKNAESKNWFHPLIKIEDFVLLLVRTNLIPEKKILIGKEEFRVKEQSLTHQKNSRKLVNEYGKETTLLANDAEKDLIILSLLLKFTTSSHLNTKKADVILKTWFSFVIHVINGFIPEEIQIVNLSNLSLSIDSGWTEYGIYEKQVWTNKKEGTFKIVQDVQKIPKTQRYKMLGNAVTVKVVEEIAKRLKIN